MSEISWVLSRHYTFQKLVFMSSLKEKHPKEKKNELLKEEIATIFQEHHGRDWAIRIIKVVNQKGILVNRKRVRKILYQFCRYTKSSTYKYKYYDRKLPSLSQPNLVNQTFKPTEKNLVRRPYLHPSERRNSLFISICWYLHEKIFGWSMDVT